MDLIGGLKPLFKKASKNGTGHAQSYLCGLMQTTSPRGKNIERMEEAVPGLEYQGVHHFIADSPWNWRPVMAQAGEEVDALLGGHPCSQLILDESCFCKKGDDSVGVARQYNGRLGKIDNCQVAVFAALGCGDRASLIGARLYLPEEWCNDPERCRKAKIPKEDRTFKTKTQLALELVREQRELGVRFEWVSVDGGYGKEPAFLRALDDMGEKFVADVHRTQMIWEENPWPCVPLPGKGGRTAKRLKAVGKPVTARAWMEVSFLASRLGEKPGDRPRVDGGASARGLAADGAEGRDKRRNALGIPPRPRLPLEPRGGGCPVVALHCSAHD